MRDMRKFYTKKFNEDSQFIRTKRNKGPKYFINCLQSYLVGEFPELAAIQYHLQNDEKTSDLELNDMIQFLGCLLYPKDISPLLDDISNNNIDIPSAKKQMSINNGKNKMINSNYKFKTIHSYLY